MRTVSVERAHHALSQGAPTTKHQQAQLQTSSAAGPLVTLNRRKRSHLSKSAIPLRRSRLLRRTPGEGVGTSSPSPVCARFMPPPVSRTGGSVKVLFENASCWFESWCRARALDDIIQARVCGPRSVVCTDYL